MSLRNAIAVAAACGAVSLSYEILWFRVFSFASGGSPEAFGLLLGFYLLGLAIGGYAAHGYCSTRSGADSNSLAVLAPLLVAAGVAGYLVAPVSARLATMVPWSALFVLVTAAAAFFGATLPIIAHAAVPPDERSGFHLSLIYIGNIGGSALGSLLTGFVFLDWWTTEQLALRLVIASLALALPFALSNRGAKRTIWVGTLCLLVGIAATLTPRLFDRLYERFLFKQSFGGGRFADVVENKEGVIAVGGDGRVFGGGAYDGFISTDIVHDHNLIVRAFGALALHEKPRHVLMIGLSTGAWAQVIANSQDVGDLTVIEINPGYLRLIAKYPQVRSLFSNPKVHIVIDDGRRWLTRHGDSRFDLVVQNTTEHWRAHTTNLLSREYFAIVRRHLLPGGIFYFNTTDSRDAYATAFAMFPFGLRLVNFAAVSDQPFGLDSARWRKVLVNHVIDGRLSIDPTSLEDRARLDSLLLLPRSIDGPPRWMGLEGRENLSRRLAGARVITDDNMLPEWHTLVLEWSTR